jgi:galactose mutarotase-like enzyme
MIYLENDFIKAGFSTKGAELQQILNVKTGENYLWKGDPNFWGKFSPILFPIVGGLKNDTYTYQGQSYKLSRHGFARDKEFRLEAQNAEELVFVLTDTPETLAVYPFKFQLAIRYKLANSSITCSYEVSNIDDKKLLFSIGGHPAFSVNTAAGLAYSDYFLEFNNDSVIEYHEIEQNLISEKTHTIMLDNGKLDLTHELFYNDALVFKTLKSDQISLCNTKNESKIDFTFKDFPYFGIWAAKDADFICLEPWCGIADVVDHNSALEDKEGIIELGADQTFIRSWNVSIT